MLARKPQPHSHNTMTVMTDGATSRASLIETCSIETTSFDHGLPAELPRGTAVYVAATPKANRDELVDRAAKLRSAGLTPVPHVVARGMESVDALTEFLTRLRDEAGADRALVLGGDLPAARGPFTSSRSILETGLFAKLGYKAVGFATYAEQHPAIPAAILDQERGLKLDDARRQGLQSWLVTQFCFHPPTLIAHVAKVRAAGISVPIHLGIAGPTSWKSLARFALLCGVKNSARFLSTQGLKAGLLLSPYDPSDTIADLDQLVRGKPELGPLGVHIFSFGGLQKTADWHAARNRIGAYVQ